MPDSGMGEPGDLPSLLTADFSKGEQFWKFWTTTKATLSDGETVRLKVLSKKTITNRFEVLCLTEMEDGTKMIWAEGYWESDAELTAFVKGIQASITHLVGREVVLEMLDFTGCDTWEKWDYKFREGTTIRLWRSEDGSSVKGNM